MKDFLSFFNANLLLDFANKAIQKHISSPEKKKPLERTIRSIHERINDENLYLALIGEFSSGKSTFINALLRKKLLKAACEATTASATFIERGSEFMVAVTFTDNKNISAIQNDYQALYEKIYHAAPDAISTSRDLTIFNLLDLLTSDERVANHISKIQIKYPSEILSKDLIIIDTPGISAGAEYAENHFDITKNIVANVADVAIVLIPSEKAMSRSLIEFLNHSLQHLLNRCIFVITAIDRIPPDEREGLIRFVRNQLKKQTKIDNPEILISSAISMIPVPRIPLSMQDEWSTWQEKFSSLEVHLFQRLNQQRKIIIAERLSFLMQVLLEEIGTELKVKKEKLQQEEKILHQGNIARVEEVINTLLEGSREKITRQKSLLTSKARNSIYSYQASAIRKSDSIITEAGWNIRSYQSEVAPKIQLAVENEAVNYIANLNRNISSLQKCCNEVCDVFITQFTKNYANFPTLNVKIEAPSVLVNTINPPSLSFSSSKNYLNQQDEEERDGRNAGAVIGGILGTLILPGWGTAIGAALGGGIGHEASGDDLENRQRKLRSFSNGEIKSYFKSYLREVERKISSTINSVMWKLESICESHIEHYSEKAQELISQHENKKMNIQKEIKSVKEDYEKTLEFKNKLILINKNLNQKI